MQVHLHVGAHKTASTFIQSRLSGAAETLSRHGVAVASHAELRHGVTDRIDFATRLGVAGLTLAHGRLARAMKTLAPKRAGIRRIVLSDENLLGPMTSVGSDAGMYPQAGARVRAAVNALGKRDVRVFLTVRDYPDVLASVFAYQSERRGMGDLEAFRRRGLAMKRGWREVARELCDAIGPERLTVWTYEAFERDPASVSDALTGVEGLDLFPASAPRRLPSLSRKGMAVMARAAPLLGEDERRRLARTLARFAFDPPDGKFEIFEGAEAARLRARYVSDIADVAALGCTLIGGARPLAGRT